MGKAFYEIKELNVDGCGSDAVVYISSEKELTQNQSEQFNVCLAKAQEYVRKNDEDWDTEDRVEYALGLFNTLFGMAVSVCADPFCGHFSF